MLREFRSLVCLTHDEDRILNLWANGNSITRISTDSNMSERTVSSVIARLRAMYDDVQPCAIQCVCAEYGDRQDTDQYPEGSTDKAWQRGF